MFNANNITMKKLKYIVLFAGLSLLSCSDLEEKVYSEISPSNFYENSTQADVAVVSIYNSVSRSSGVFDFGMASLTFMPSPYALSRVPFRKYWANYTVTSSDPTSLPRVWNGFYQAIFRANVAITELEKRNFESNIEETKRKALIAEAKWLRGWSYFNLVRLFGEVPMPLVPTKSIEESQLPKTPIATIYNQIISDLQYSEANLPTQKRTGAGIGRPIVGTAKFLLAKVYLTMAGKPMQDASKMTMAHTKIKEVIDNASIYGYKLLPSYEEAIRIDNNEERIFAIQQTQTVEDQGTTMAFVWGAQQSPYVLGDGVGGQFHGGYNLIFYNSFEAADKRRDVTMLYQYVGRDGKLRTYAKPGPFPVGTANYPVSFGIAPNKYQDTNQTCCNGDPDINIYRYSDALLMYAETENSLNGPTAVAYTYLNMVRSRAGASSIPAGKTKAEFAELLYQERFKELSFEFHEVFDERRLGKVQEVISLNPEAKAVNTVYNSKFELWPIPLSEIQANPKMTENNPGW